MGYSGDVTKRLAPSASPLQPRRWVTFEDSSLDSNVETTSKTADWSQAIEVDDSLPPSVAPEMEDWSQSKEGDLGGPSMLDPKVKEFFSGEELKDDPATEECPSKPSFAQ